MKKNYPTMTEIDNYLTNWEKNSEKFIENIKDIYTTNNLTLILGSGVSKASGVPLWPDLVRELYAKLVVNKFQSISPDWNVLELKNHDLILQARYIKKGYGSKTEFFEAIENSLYNQKININKPLINAVGELCMPSRFKFLKSVITYNFDDILERKLDKMSVEYKSIFDSNVSYKKSSLPIYHVHGFLPENSKNYEDIQIIFSDDDYNKQSSGDLFSWSNIIQLTNFKDSCNLFVGCSFNDANLRRLLEIAKNNFKQVTNYTILKHSFDKDKHDIKMKNIFYINDYLKESVLNDLGIKIIWVDEFEEIPIIINKIKNS